MKQKNYLNKIDLRYKLIWLTSTIILSIYLTDLLKLFPILFTVIAFMFFFFLNIQDISNKIKTISPFILIIIFFTTIIRTQDPFFLYKTLSFSKKGLELGLIYSTRLLIFVLSFTLITQTTQTEEFLEVLKKTKTPYPLVIAFLITIRFIPTMKKKHQKLIESQKTRGIDYENQSWSKKLRTDIKSLVPVFIEGVRRSETLTMALLTRGFGDFEQKTNFYELKTKKIDYIFLTITIIELTIILLIKTN